ncbi:MAG: type secretion system protein VasJ [Desulfovibrionales bacterium]|jgi:type VI secretion system protein VasJ|nr:type secretion system protein VasJ [Desulfovibrionales bacterium]
MDLMELGKKPISDAKPAGEDARYEPEFDELQAEIDKLSVATASGEPIDWKKTIKLAATILDVKSKNLMAAAYLAAGLIQLRKVDGLALGAQILKDMVVNFWDTMYPPKKRLRGRVNAIEWWRDKALDFLQAFEADQPLPKETYDRLVENLKDLDETLGEKLDSPPMLRELQGYAERLPVQAPEPEAAPEPEPDASSAEGDAEQAAGASPSSEEKPSEQAAPAAAAPSPQKSSAPPPSSTGPAPTPTGDHASDAKKLVRFGLDQLAQAADFYLKLDASNPMSYQLRRLSAWLQVEALPPAENGQTMIPPPDSAVKAAIENLLASREFENAILASESRVAEFLFWLDISRLTAKALDGLGARGADARLAVEQETAQYVKKLRGIENYTFSDGSPFADKDTKLWLKSLNQQAGGGGGGGGSVAQQRIDEALAKAREQLGAKKIAEGLEVMQQTLDNAGGGMARFLAHVAMARLLTEAGKLALAKPHADLAVEEIERRNLDVWDPDAALGGLSAAYDVYSMTEGDEAQAVATKILERISRISPASALRICGES